MQANGVMTLVGYARKVGEDYIVLSKPSGT